MKFLRQIFYGLVAVSAVSGMAKSEELCPENCVPASMVAPKFLIVRVPVTGDAQNSTDQKPFATTEVYPVTIAIDCEMDGTLDKVKVKAKLIEALKDVKPIVLNESTINPVSLPDDLRKEFVRAEKETEDSSGAKGGVVAWRHYGPITGYSAGIVAHGRSPYMGYYPATPIPYYGYYIGGQVYNYNYGAYTRAGGYHYYGYYRHY